MTLINNKLFSEILTKFDNNRKGTAVGGAFFENN